MQKKSADKRSYFLKVSLQNKRMRLSNAAKVLERMIGNSSFLNPYQTQSESPEIKIISIKAERSSVFFVLKTLITCGRDAILVSTPAMSPKIFSFTS